MAVRADARLRWESAPVGGGEGECELLVAEGVRLRARYVLVAEIAVDRHLLILRALVPPLAVPAAQRRLEGLLDAAEDAVALCTLERRFARLNRAAVRLYGLSEREAIGRRLELIVPDERASELAAAWEAAIRDEPAAPIEFEWSGGTPRDRLTGTQAAHRPRRKRDRGRRGRSRRDGHPAPGGPAGGCASGCRGGRPSQGRRPWRSSTTPCAHH